jgi:hypothetical protein
MLDVVTEKVVGKYDLGDRNDQRDILIQFCLEEKYLEEIYHRKHILRFSATSTIYVEITTR